MLCHVETEDAAARVREDQEDEQDALPASPDLRKPGPENPIRRLQPRTLDGLLAHGELVSQGQDLQLHRGTASEQRNDEGKQGSKDVSHAGRRYPAVSREARSACAKTAENASAVLISGI